MVDRRACVYLSYTPSDRRWCFYTATLVVGMSVNGSTLNVSLWLTVSSEGSRLCLGAWASFVCPRVYVDGRTV